MGKEIDNYFVVKGLQLYLEGISYREIERILGISHVTVSNWVKKFGVKKPINSAYHPSYKIITHNELIEFIQKKENVLGKGMILTEVGDKFMLIKWDRFKK
jgi:transposase